MKKTTRYFRQQVMRKRPYIDPSWCAAVIAAPIRRETQPDGRIRFWENIRSPGDEASCILLGILLVITLADGETVYNAFFDREFREDGS
ncbi:MAG: hypothetical protein OYH76_11650 [Defluviicoccus sp.]|nr:hypothetical protein [Defluviicoccus sp.]MDE0276540.1 hypothetical protein [Defluviicoccus sp.]